MEINSDYLQLVFDGALMTIQVSVLSMILGMVLAIIFLVFQKLKFRPISFAFEVLLMILRGLPEIVMVFIVFYSGSQLLLDLFDIDFPAYHAGIIALALIFAAYASQSLRGAIEAIPQGQWLAARAMGLSNVKIFFHIILPQMWRLALPGLTNQWLSLLKDSSLVSTIGIAETIFQTNSVIKVTHQPFIWYSIAGVLYLIISVSSTYLLKLLDRRLNHYLVPAK